MTDTITKPWDRMTRSERVALIASMRARRIYFTCDDHPFVLERRHHGETQHPVCAHPARTG